MTTTVDNTPITSDDLTYLNTNLDSVLMATPITNKKLQYLNENINVVIEYLCKHEDGLGFYTGLFDNEANTDIRVVRWHDGMSIEVGHCCVDKLPQWRPLFAYVKKHAPVTRKPVLK